MRLIAWCLSMFNKLLKIMVIVILYACCISEGASALDAWDILVRPGALRNWAIRNFWELKTVEYLVRLVCSLFAVPQIAVLTNALA